MELKTYFAQDLQGNVIPSPTVYIYQPGTTTLANGLQTANGAALTNPFTGSSTGQIQLRAPNGAYDMRIAGAGRDYTIRVQFIDLDQQVAEAQSILNDFKGRWYGALASDPTTDPTGAPVGAGDAYFNTTLNQTRVYSGASWQASFTGDAAGVSYTPAGTGAVTTTVQEELRRHEVNVFQFMTPTQIADVQSYTASIDVTSAILAARDAAYGKTLRFPAGKYRHTGIGIDPNKPCKFVGDGYGPSGNYGTILYNVGTSHSIGIQNTGTSNDVVHVFEDMMIVGTTGSACGIWGENEHGIRAKRLWITGHGRHGVYLVDGWSNKFENCVITHNQQAGVALQNRCNNVTFDKCIINGNDDSGLGYSNVQMNANTGLENLNVNLINCDISYVGSTTGFCLLVLGTYGLNVTGCYLEGGMAGTKLLYVATNTKSCEFKSCYFQDGAITAETGTDIRFIGNIIHKQYYTTTLTLNNPGGTEYVSENNSFTGGATANYSNGAGSIVEGYKNSPPTVGTWEAGSVIYRTYFAGGVNHGWVCVTGGTPGTWVPFGVVPSVYADHGDASATLTYLSSFPTNLWKSPLTANRTVTLSTTNAVSGAKFRISRSASATGAFTLDVGGMKSLSAGQWCDVEYDGSAWRLTAFGSL